MCSLLCTFSGSSVNFLRTIDKICIAACGKCWVKGIFKRNYKTTVLACLFWTLTIFISSCAWVQISVQSILRPFTHIPTWAVTQDSYKCASFSLIVIVVTSLYLWVLSSLIYLLSLLIIRCWRIQSLEGYIYCIDVIIFEWLYCFMQRFLIHYSSSE